MQKVVVRVTSFPVAKAVYNAVKMGCSHLTELHVPLDLAGSKEVTFYVFDSPEPCTLRLVRVTPIWWRLLLLDSRPLKRSSAGRGVGEQQQSLSRVF
jgi:hypothetical protein